MSLAFALRGRLLALVLLAASPIVVAVVMTSMHERALALSNLKTELLSIARTAIASQDEYKAAAYQVLSSLSASPAIRSSDGNQCAETLGPIVQRGGLFINILVTDLEGRVRCSGLPFKGEVNVGDQTSFRRAVATRSYAAGSFQIGRITGQPSMNYAFPIFDKTGGSGAVLLAVLPLSPIIQNLRETRLPPGAIITLIAPDLTIVERFPRDEWVGKSVSGTDMHRLIAAQGDEALAKIPALVPETRVHAVTTSRNPVSGEVSGYFVISVPDQAILAPVIRSTQREILYVGLLVLAIAIIAVLGADLLVLKGINTVLEAARRIAGGDFTARAQVPTGHTELGALAAAFNTMADKTEARMEAHSSLNRVYEVSAAIDSAIVRLEDPGQLADQACRTAVDVGGYRMASLHRVDDGTSSARLAAHAGGQEIDFQNALFNIDATLSPESGPIRKALETGVHVIEQDVDPLPGVQWMKAFHQSGCRSLAAFPLVRNQRVLGVFSLFSTERNAFDNENEIKRLLALASDMAWGLDRNRT